MNQRIRETEKSLRRETPKRKAAEEALQITRETFKQAMKEMPVIIFATDEDGGVVFFNREFERVSGYSAADIFDNSEADFIHSICPECVKLLYPGYGKNNI